MKIVNTFDKHRNEPDISLDEYTQEVKLKLGRDISKCKKIYLDTNYWLSFRDIILGRGKNEKFEELLTLLRRGIKSERFICPISEDILIEILRSDYTCLDETAQIVDELYSGVSIMSTIERTRLEILYFLRRSTQGDSYVHSPDIFVWTKVPYALGLVHPTSTPFSTEKELVVQKAFFDQMWSTSLSYMVEVMGTKTFLSIPKLRDVTENLNRDKVKFAHENNSFKQIYLSEMAAVLEMFMHEFEDALIHFYETETGRKPQKTELQSANTGQQLANMIYNALKRNKLKTYLPTLTIEASLYASVRLDIERKFTKNDLHDFRHAQTALPYYDFFFTEHSLKDLVSRKKIELNKKYNCTVVSFPDEAIKCINNSS
jgi:hypothetical protein